MRQSGTSPTKRGSGNDREAVESAVNEVIAEKEADRLEWEEIFKEHFGD